MEKTIKCLSKSGMVGFWFGIGLMLAVKTVNNLEYCINRNVYKMAEENQVMKEPQGEVTQLPSRAQPSTTNNERTTTSNYKEPKESRSG